MQQHVIITSFHRDIAALCGPARPPSAKQYCRYGMEVAMLANTTGAASLVVRAEIGMGAAPIVISVLTTRQAAP